MKGREEASGELGVASTSRFAMISLVSFLEASLAFVV